MDGNSELIVYYNMTYRNFSFVVLDPACNRTNPATGIIIGESTLNSTQADGFMNVETNLLFNASEIESNDDVWTGNDIGGEINFCLLASLWNDDDYDETTGKMITFDETKFSIDVDKTSNFTLDNISINRASAESVDGPDIDYDAELKAYQCDASLEEINNPAPLSQKNNILSMCIHSTSTIQVSSIVTLTLYQKATNAFPSYTYEAIDNGSPENIALVVQSTSAQNENRQTVVRVQVVLSATLFANPDPAPIDASGTVALDVTGSTDGRRRHLLIEFASLLSSDSGQNENKEDRLLRDNAASQDFSLSAELVGNGSAGGLSTTLGSFSTIAGGALLTGVVFI